MAKHPICRWCRRELIRPANDPLRTYDLSATRDHIIPKSKGGTQTAWCCRQCNQLKGDMTLIEWARFMQDFPMWETRFRNRGHMLREIARKKERDRYTFPFTVAKPSFCRGLK